MKRQREDAAVSTAGDALEEVVSPPRASTQSFFAPGSQEQDQVEETVLKRQKISVGLDNQPETEQNCEMVPEKVEDQRVSNIEAALPEPAP